ncbi:hypothetical protein F4803DRAFT_512583 [Xylaria telfairii]|nr:hypothetical protein F4803DRAFT_512583 [Xylaria telfairii]
MNYERRGTQNVPGNNTRDGSGTSPSAEWLPRVPNTDRSMPAEVGYSGSVSSSDNSFLWDTDSEPDEVRLADPKTWKYLFAPEPHAPSATIAERVQKMRVRKWMKRISFKTRARFQLVGKRIPESRFIEERAKRRRELEMEALGPPPWSNGWRDCPDDQWGDLIFY